ncbi:hypothetical protein PA10_00159 [Pseudomonas phage pPa_SNUABM_DT01]|nr:hypothetical protein PA10_00159 [Pseudomonas phage pPa_SNUABM_DT01]
MTAALNSLMVASGDTMFHSPDFLSFVHAHEAYLKANCVPAALDPGVVHKFEYNFASLMIELGYPIENLLIFMVVNNFDCPTQMTMDFKQIMVPDPGVVDNLKNLYRLTPGRI